MEIGSLEYLEKKTHSKVLLCEKYTNTIKESTQLGKKSLQENFLNQAVKPINIRARGFKHSLKGFWLQEEVQVIKKDFIAFYLSPKRRLKIDDEMAFNYLKINRKVLNDTRICIVVYLSLYVVYPFMQKSDQLVIVMLYSCNEGFYFSSRYKKTVWAIFSLNWPIEKTRCSHHSPGTTLFLLV